MIKVSVITPFYNGSKYIKECIESVNSQSFLDIEHIIVDDGSREEELSILRDISKEFSNIVIFSKKNEKQAAAVNFGIKQAKGEYIAFCDHDDWWIKDKLEKQVKFLEENKNVGLVYSDAFIGDEKGNILSETWMQSRGVLPHEGGYSECIKDIFHKNFVCAPLIMLVRKSVFDAMGLMDEKMTSAYDYDFLVRFLEAGYKLGFIKEPLAVWRVHSGQESGDIRKAKKMQAMILFGFLMRNKKFLIQHPALVFEKIVKTIFAYILNFNPYRKN